VKYISDVYRSVLGDIVMASDVSGEYLVGLWFVGQKYYPDTRQYEIVKEDKPVFKMTREWLDQYFLGKNPKFDNIKLRPEGTDFRKAVWEILLDIPYGETTSYGQIANLVADKMGKKSMSAQAVGGAIGHNPISIIIPCHRVVGRNGELTGYAGGIDKKASLLELELKHKNRHRL